jgi:acyl-CoA hydrolase
MNEAVIEKNSKISQDFSKPASDESLNRTIAALSKNGIQSFAFDSEETLKQKLFELLPEKAEIMTMTSVTIDTLGITEEILNSGRYEPVRNKMKLLDEKSKRKMGSNADYSVGSVHAITENGEVLIASSTGSQISAYAYASGKVIWVVGTQKIVKDKEEGIKRIYEYCFPLEDARARKAYNAGSKVGKILTINSEVPGRLTILFLKQNIGF